MPVKGLPTSTSNQNSKWVTTAQAAALLGVAPHYLYTLTRMGKLAYRSVGEGRGGTRLYLRADILEYKAAHPRVGLRARLAAAPPAILAPQPSTPLRAAAV